MNLLAFFGRNNDRIQGFQVVSEKIKRVDRAMVILVPCFMDIIENEPVDVDNSEVVLWHKEHEGYQDLKSNGCSWLHLHIHYEDRRSIDTDQYIMVTLLSLQNAIQEQMREGSGSTRPRNDVSYRQIRKRKPLLTRDPWRPLSSDRQQSILHVSPRPQARTRSFLSKTAKIESETLQ
jgi:hypothetical protein